MAAKKRGLGRGLDALLGSARPEAAPAAAPGAAAAPGDSDSDGDLRTLGVDQLQRGKYQPRRDMHQESLEELADSIRAQGLVQPIVVRPVDGGRYEIIAGERRWRAAQLAGLQDVPVVVRDIDDRAAIAMALIENIQREDLNPLEEAHALKRLIDEFDMTHQQAAEAVGRSRAAVSNLLRLLELGEVATAMVQNGELEMGHARALLALSGRHQAEAARQVQARGLSVRATERLVQKLLAESEAGAASRPAPRRRNPDLVRLEQGLADRLGAPVQIQYNDKGKGRLVISYNSLDELDGILEHIR
ncbi:MAG TPA: ParB/RepB/Spo0J family partition protein [Gammaproteobacteria bacterium]|nr:ParB/RepB/Spo0J family partition protein [Gammaproteobacteria bacterium]